MATPTLLGHLANLGSLSSQGEPLCTHSLVYLLRTYPGASQALIDELRGRTNVPIETGLTWHAEVVQVDKKRPDVEARTTEGVIVVKIEAKLDADFQPDQLQCYLADLKRQAPCGALIVLVPRFRCEEAARFTSRALGLPGPGPSWPTSGEHPFGVAVLSWEELFAVLRESESIRFVVELEQLEALYEVLSGSYIAPLAGSEELRAWKKDGKPDEKFVKIADKVTSVLRGNDKLLPLDKETIDQTPDELDRGDCFGHYLRRYVRCLTGNGKSYYCIGLRDPFLGYKTPIWLRFHRETGDFVQIRQRIADSSIKWVESGGHIWVPLEPLTDTPVEKVVDDLVAQAEEIARVACPGGLAPR